MLPILCSKYNGNVFFQEAEESKQNHEQTPAFVPGKVMYIKETRKRIHRRYVCLSVCLMYILCVYTVLVCEYHRVR